MAGQTIATLHVQVQPSFRGVTAEIDKGLAKPLQRAGEQAGDQAGKGFADRFERSTGRSLEGVATRGLVAFAGMSVGLFKAAGAAGNLNAAIAASEQVLGDASSAAQDWAENSVEAVGLSEAAALDASTSFGQLGKILGLTGRPLADFSTGMVEAAADMAAFKDVPVAQALADLQSGFAGQTEVLRKYGIFLDEASLKQAYFDETGVQVSGTLTAQQRILATHAAVMAQGVDMWGQWDREADGWAATQSKASAALTEFGASIGQAALPGLTSLLGAATAGAEGLTSLNDATGGAIGTLATVATVGVGAASAFGLTASKMSGLVDGFGAMSRAARVSTVAFGAVGLAATAGFLIYQSMGAKQREMEARTKEVAAALGDQVRETFNLAEATANAAGEIDGAAAAQRAFSAALTDGGEDGEKLTAALGALGRESAEALEILTDVGNDPVTALEELARSAGVAGDGVGILAQAVNDTDSNRLDDLGASIKFFAVEAGYSRDEAAQLANELGPLAQALEQVQDSAEASDLNAMASTFLNQEVAAGGAAAKTVLLAEAMSGLSRNGERATDLYLVYGALMGRLGEAHRDAALGGNELSTAMDTAADATDGLNMVAASTLDVMSDQERTLANAADAAGAFSDALARLAGSQISVQAAQDDFNAGMDEINKTIWEATAGTEGYSLSLDATTEAGRQNRDMIRQQAERVLSLGESMLEAGSSVEETSAAMTYNTAVLRNQLVAFGLTEQEADAYIATLGLTPENIDTAVNLYNDDAAKRRVQEYIDNLGDIPENERTEIQALIDSGAYNEAERRLAVLARSRTASIIADYRPASGYSGSRSMAGNLFTSPGFTSIAEDGDPEWVAPLGKPALMRRWLQDRRILDPVLAALPPMQGSDGSSGGVTVGQLTVGSTDDLPKVEAALRSIEWRRRLVPVPA